MKIEILNRFCSSDPESKYARPVTYGIYTYATDQKGIIIRVDRLETVPEESSGRGPFALLPWLESFENAPLEPLPTLPDTTPKWETTFCERCGGHGRLENCKTCNGAGIVGDHLNRMKCPDCGHSLRKRCPVCKNIPAKKQFGSSGGPIRCPRCKGTGEHRKKAAISYLDQPSIRTFQIGKKVFYLKYLKLISSLEGLRVSPAANGPEEPMPFTFQGGDGLLYPLRRSG